ncbi:MAG: methionyl-tRNA formyltransferase [Chlamydiae bacterium]|nr:methionyl-tRNA formyltransferase [Chlamydiota bacterium]
MKIVFFGTSKFAAHILEFLLHQKDLTLLAIVTRADKPQGRFLHMAFPPVKEFAVRQKVQIPILQPEKASTPEFVEELRKLKPDLFVVVAYGEILKQDLLDIPSRGSINVHASILPKYRGAAPMQRCLMNGDSETGITIIEMTAKMDAGDILAVEKMAIPKDMNFGELEERLIPQACKSLLKAIRDIQSGRQRKIPQDPSQVTLAPKITPEEGKIHWNRPAKEVHNLIRALSPHPGAWCWIETNQIKKRLKIFRTEVMADVRGKPGETIKFQESEWIVAADPGGIKILELQLEGKRKMSIKDFFSGLKKIPINLF